MEENEKVMNRGGESADGTPLLLGNTKASLSTDSFISVSATLHGDAFEPQAV
jgi:DNA-directed RNA polymerase subunit beta'